MSTGEVPAPRTSVALSVPVLDPDTVDDAAACLGITAGELRQIARGEAYWYAGRTWLDVPSLWDENVHAVDKGIISLDELVEAHPELAPYVLRDILSEANGERLRGRPDPLDAALVALLEASKICDRMKKLGAPRLALRRHAASVQRAFDVVTALDRGDRATSTEWLDARALASEPAHGVFVPDEREHATVYDARLLDDAVLLMFGALGIAVRFDGTVGDVFPNATLRATADDGACVQFVSERPGITAVRDTRARRWSIDAVETLPRVVVANLGEDRTAAVFDRDGARGYRVSPFHPYATHATILDARGHFVYDGEAFVREAATGAYVRDVRHLRDRVREADGDWVVSSFTELDGVFLFSTLEGVLDEDGQLLRAREHDELIVFGPARQLLACTPHAARVIDVHTGEVSVTIDLRPIVAALIPPIPPRVPASR